MKPLTISSDFAGLAGTSIGIIGTVAITKEVANAMRGFGGSQRKSYRRSTRSRKR